MVELIYKGYRIEAHPEQETESSEWSTFILIRDDWEHNATDQIFVDYKTFQSKEDATEHCLNFGKQLINRDDFEKYMVKIER